MLVGIKKGENVILDIDSHVVKKMNIRGASALWGVFIDLWELLYFGFWIWLFFVLDWIYVEFFFGPI